MLSLGLPGPECLDENLSLKLSGITNILLRQLKAGLDPSVSPR